MEVPLMMAVLVTAFSEGASRTAHQPVDHYDWRAPHSDAVRRQIEVNWRSPPLTTIRSRRKRK
jgi:hypothetical protein